MFLFGNLQFDPDPAGGLPGGPVVDHEARARDLAAENQRLKIEAELSRALGARISGQAAHDAARLLALDANFNDVAGEITHPRFGIGAGAIAESFLSGQGSYLLNSNANGNGNGARTSAPAGWDIERAKRDAEYLEAWRRADGAGFDRAWKQMLEGMHRNLRTGKA